MARGGARAGAGRPALSAAEYFTRLCTGAALAAEIDREHWDDIEKAVDSLPLVRKLTAMRASVETTLGRSSAAAEKIEALAAEIYTDRRFRAARVSVSRAYKKKVLNDFATARSISPRMARNCLSIYRRFEARLAREDAEPVGDDGWPPLLLEALRVLAGKSEGPSVPVPAEDWEAHLETLAAHLAMNGETPAVMLARIEQQTRMAP